MNGKPVYVISQKPVENKKTFKNKEFIEIKAGRTEKERKEKAKGGKTIFLPRRTRRNTKEGKKHLRIKIFNLPKAFSRRWF